MEKWVEDNYRALVADGRDPSDLATDVERHGGSSELVALIRSLIVAKPTKKETTRSAAPVEKR